MTSTGFLSRALLGVSLLAAGLPAAAEPVFGPCTYVRTAGAPNVFEDSFTLPTPARCLLLVQNGEDGANQVTSGSVEVNGVPLVGAAELGSANELITRPLVVPVGTSSVRVTLAGEPGSFLTVLIVPRFEQVDASMGRLLLPHGHAANLVVQLKNGAHRPRGVRLVFFDESGAVTGSSDRLLLPAHGSLSQPVASLIQNGTWTHGSIEVFFAGPGAGGVHGQAAFVEPGSGLGGIVPLQAGGYRRLFIPVPQS